MSKRDGITFKEWWARHEEDVPAPPHYIYYLYNAEDELIYVGKARDPRRRMVGHWNTAEWFMEVDRIEVEEFLTERFASEEEWRVIQRLKPRYNLQGTGRAEREKSRIDKPIAEDEVVWDNGYRCYVDGEGCWDTIYQASDEYDVTHQELKRLLKTGEVKSKQMSGELRVMTGDATLEDFEEEELEADTGVGYRILKPTWDDEGDREL